MRVVVLWPRAISLSPPAEEAAEPQAETGEGLGAQSVPELVEVYAEPSLASATILLPSAEHVRDHHIFEGAVVGVQACE